MTCLKYQLASWETRNRTQMVSLWRLSFASNDSPFSADLSGTKLNIFGSTWYRIFLPLLISNTSKVFSRKIRRRGGVYNFSIVFSTKCKETDLVLDYLNHQIIGMWTFCFKPMSTWRQECLVKEQWLRIQTL